MASDSEGDDVAIWTATASGGTPQIQVASRASGGQWQPARSLGTKEGPEGPAPQVAVTAHGHPLAVWWGAGEAGNAIESAGGDLADGSWQTPVPISGAVPYGSSPMLAVDGQGDAVAVWENGLGFGISSIQAAGYDAAGPQLADSIPGAGVVGAPISFSVSPLDVWSALGATNWSFGDETGASGLSVTHTYARAGVYGVTVSSADVLGNSTSQAGTVVISLPRPTITRATQSAARWREGNRPAVISRRRRAPIGTTFSVTLDREATVRFAFTRRFHGRRVNGRCVARTHKNSHRRLCTRTVTVGRISFSGHSGANTLAFQGRISTSKKLPSGSYRAVITATNATGPSSPRKLNFTIVR